jgi:hypothetical protein
MRERAQRVRHRRVGRGGDHRSPEALRDRRRDGIQDSGLAEPARGDDLDNLAVRSGFHDLTDQHRAADKVTTREGIAQAGRGWGAG